MTTLQELITRGRHVLANAPSRLRVFDAVDGRRSVTDIAVLIERHPNNVRTDLALLRDVGLIQAAGLRNPVYSKVPLVKSIARKYFEPTSKRPTNVALPEAAPHSRRPVREPRGLAVPTAGEILEIARRGEDQFYEFKAAGAEVQKLTREIAAMLHSSLGGIVLYGVDDDGTIVGSDMSRQKMDQPLQNSIKNGISPAASIKLSSVTVVGNDILVIVVPPWNRRDVYQFGERILIRKGTNVFAAKPEEIRSLHDGKVLL